MGQAGVEHRALKVGAVTGLSSVTAIVMQIITVPVCLNYWGKETYGIWLALFALFAMLQTTGTGYVNYTGNQINLLYHQDQAALQRTLASALAGVALLGGVQLAAVLATFGLGVLPDLLGISGKMAETNEANLALLSLAGSWVLGGFYFGVVHRLLIPAGMMYQAAWWSLGSQLSLFLVVMISALAHASILQTSLFYALVQFLFVASSAWYIRHKLPQFYPWWRGFNLAHGLRDLYRSSSQTASGLIQQGASNGLVVLVSTISGAAAVPVFTTVRTLSNLWTNITNVMTTPLLPDVVRFHATGERKKLVAVQEVHGVLVGTAVNLSILLAYPFIEPMYRYWTSGTVELNKVLLCALLASVSLMNLGAMMNTYLNGINHHRALLSTALARGGIGLIIGGLMMSYFGVGGLGIGVWLGELTALLFLVHFFSAINRSEGFMARIGSMAPSLVSVMSLHLFMGAEALEIGSTGWLLLISVSGICIGAYWGWHCLDESVNKRLLGLFGSRIGMKAGV